MKTLLVGLAVAASALATQTAHAVTVFVNSDTPTTGWERIGGWEGIDGFGGFREDGMLAFGGDPRGGVLVTGNKKCGTCPIIDSPSLINLPPPAIYPQQGRDGEPFTPPKDRADCVAGCSVARTINNNNCAASKDQLRTNLTTVPGYMNSYGTFIRLFKGGKVGAPDPEWGNTAYGMFKDEIDRKLADFESQCTANAGRAENLCLQGCPALFLPLATVPFWRRHRPDEEVKQA